MKSATASRVNNRLSYFLQRYFYNHSIFKIILHHIAPLAQEIKSKFILLRGVIFYLLGANKNAVADFSKVLRLDWRNERVVIWIDRAERAHRITLRRQASQAEGEENGMIHPLSVWDRPTRHQFAFARI